MEIILLERMRGLGKIGDVVKVKPGFARNFLIPQQKATMATKANMEAFEARRKELEAKDAALVAKANDLAKQVGEVSLTMKARVSEEGRLYGSITARDIAHAIQEQGVHVDVAMVDMPEGPIRELGQFKVHVLCHMDVEAAVPVEVVAEETEAH
jgi:large subunit ribosomal protein L9